MNELIVKAGKVTINSNLTEIKAQALEVAKKYDVEVTVDNQKEAKGLSTEINKIKAQLKKVSKENIDILSEPILAFKSEVKEVEGILETTRQKLIEGVRVFDDARRLEHKGKLEEYFNHLVKEQEIRPENVEVNGILNLITLTGLTSAGELNKKSKDGVAALVTALKNTQVTKDLEQKEKEAEEKRRIDEEVAKKLEVEKERERQRVEKKHQEELEKARAAAPTPQPKQEPKPQPTQAPTSGKSIYQISFDFEIKAKPGVSSEKVIEKVKTMFLKDGVVPISSKCLEIVYED